MIRPTRIAILALLLSAGAAAPAGAQAKARQCRDCHPDIYAEWKKSQHARAFSDPRFQAALKVAEKPETCTPCHAPNPILEAGIGVYPTLRRRPSKREGVTCVTCHQKGDAYGGPYKGKDMDDVGHYSVEVKAFTSYKLCATCHGQAKEKVHNQVRDFLKGAAFKKKGKRCQDCHMPRILRPAAVDTMGKIKYKKRPGRKHTFVGSSNAGMLKKAAKVAVKVVGRVARATVTNVESGHAIPAAADRALCVEFVFTPANKRAKPTTVVVKWGWNERLHQHQKRTAEAKLPSGAGTVTVTLWHLHAVNAPRKEWATMRSATAKYK